MLISYKLGCKVLHNIMIAGFYPELKKKYTSWVFCNRVFTFDTVK